MNFGKRVQDCRQSVGLSQAELAVYSGLSQSRISRLELSHSSAKMDEVKRLADAFGMTILELLDEKVKLSLELVKRNDEAPGGEILVRFVGQEED